MGDGRPAGLDLVGQRLITNQLTLTVGHDIDNLRDPECRRRYHGEVKVDRYGRQIHKHAHGTASLDSYTASFKRITAVILEVYCVVDKDLLVRRMYLARERKLQEAMLGIKSKYGKNAILKGTNLIDGAAAERNGKIGGHRT